MLQRFMFPVMVIVSCLGQPGLGELPVGFVDEFVADGIREDIPFSRPISMRFLPNGDLLVLEKDGVVKRVTNPTTHDAVVVDYMTLLNVWPDGHSGLRDIAIHPLFSQNNYIYIFYARALPDIRSLVQRFTYTGEASDYGTRVDEWIANFPHNNKSHHGGGLEFGPDEDPDPEATRYLLYITVGDDHTGPALLDAMDPTTDKGKVIRFDPAAPLGAVPTDNPLWDPDDNPWWDGDPVRNQVWAMGLRNPFRASLDLEGSPARLYIGEVGTAGPTAYEDIHVADIGGGGLNYRWPACEGPCPNPAFSECETHDCYDAGTAPIFTYAHPDEGPSASAVIGGFVYRRQGGSKEFPAAYDGVYFYGDFARGFLRYLDLGDPVVSNEFGDTVGFPQQKVVAMRQGPDDALYYLTFSLSPFYPTELRRIAFSEAPMIVFVDADPSFSHVVPRAVDLSGLAIDPEGEEVSYRWRLTDPNGAVTWDPVNPDPMGNDIEHVFTLAGIHEARLEARDTVPNIVLSDPILIRLGLAPVPTITQPSSCQSFDAGDTIDLHATAYDDDDPAELTYEWQVDLADGDLLPNDRIGFLTFPPDTNGTGGSQQSFVVPDTVLPDGDEFGKYDAFDITLMVTDPEGLSNTQSILMYPNRVNVTIDSVPCGARVLVGGSEPSVHTTPFVYSALKGMQLEFTVLSGCAFSKRVVFDEWQDDVTEGNPRIITIPNTDQTFTAILTTLDEHCVDAPLLADLKMQLVAEAGVVTTGSDVDSWSDQWMSNVLLGSGNGRPDLVVDGLNGRNYVQFDGADDVLEPSAQDNPSFPEGDEHRTIFTVVRYSGPGWGGFTYGPDDPPTDNTTFGLAVDDDTKSGGGKLAIQGWGTADDSSTTVGEGAGWMIQTVSRFNDSGLEVTRHYKSDATGDVEIDSTTHTWATLSEDIRLGAKFDKNTFVDMDVAEVLVYARGMDATERGQVWDYLRDRYFDPAPASPPRAADDLALVRPGMAVDIAVLDNDCQTTDAIDPATLQIIQQPLNAETLTIANGVVTYGHRLSAGAGWDSFTYTVKDIAGRESAETVVDVLANCPIKNCDGVLYVDAGAAPGGSGTSWAEAFQYPQDALDHACPGDEIWVADGSYRPDQGQSQTPGDRSATFQLLDGVSIYGGFLGGETDLSQRDFVANETILSGDLFGDDNPDFPFGLNLDNSFHVVTGTGTDASALLDGFTVIGGNADAAGFPVPMDGHGGGLLVHGTAPNVNAGQPTIRNCRLRVNSARIGGGVSVTRGQPTLRDCKIDENRGTLYGGGLFNGGGGVPPTFGQTHIINCRFVRNTASQWGAGARTLDSGPLFVDCEFSENQAVNDPPAILGGGLSVGCSANCVPPPRLVNCTLALNDAATGGGVYVEEMIDQNGPAVMTNSIFWGNTDDDAGGTTETAQIHIVSGSVEVTNNCIEGLTDPGPFEPGGGNIGDEPGWVHLGVGNSRVAGGSATNDAGDNAALDDLRVSVTLDRDGSVRRLDDPDAPPVGNVVDMGAYEFGHPYVVQGRLGVPFDLHAYSGYIDPRAHWDSAQDPAGIDRVTMIFSEEVRELGGQPLGPSSFVAEETGGGLPPAIVAVVHCVIPADGNPGCDDYNQPGDQDTGWHVVLVCLDRFITFQEWTTIIAQVEGLQANPVNGSDRVIFGWLPGDVNQSATVSPFDLLRLRVLINDPSEFDLDRGSVLDLIDMDRNGVSTPFDLLDFRRLINGVPPATQDWAGEIMNASLPICCR